MLYTFFGTPRRPRRITRWLARRIWPERSLAQATQDLIHLEGVMRFVGLFLVTIFLPSLLLAGLAVTGSRNSDLAAMAELESEAGASVDEAIKRLETSFTRFETNTLSRLQRGQSPTESLADLSPNLLLALRLDANMQMVAPFQEAGTCPPVDRSFFFMGDYAEGRQLEMEKGEYGKAALAYARASQKARGMVLKGSAEIQRARALAKDGQSREAESLYADIVADFSTFRDPWGFPLGDLARLKRGELQMEREPIIGVGALASVAEDILARRWEVGQGGEAAIARRALVLMEGSADAETIGTLRKRLDERTSQLYWAERLLPELVPLTRGGVILKTTSGNFTYRHRGQALWALLWFGEDLYAFALDWDALVHSAYQASDYAVRSDSPIKVTVLDGETQPPQDVLARRTLVPWFSGWSLVAHPKDPAALKASFARRSVRRILVITSAIVVMAFGVIMSASLVAREMDMARMKTSFVANVSHELRSPITQIRLKGESLLLGLAEDEADQQRHYTAIVRESERLSRLVDNVLDFAAIERGTKQYNIRPADFYDTLVHALETMRFSMESRGLELHAEFPDDLPITPHDPDAVAQVITNLLSNAAKYGGGWVQISATPLPDGVLVEVADRGIGIAPAELDRVFDQFYRSTDPEARSRKGTGIGLAIVKYIMECHGGSVSVRSHPGQGSVFSLFFPLSPPKDVEALDAKNPVRRG